MFIKLLAFARGFARVNFNSDYPKNVIVVLLESSTVFRDEKYPMFTYVPVHLTFHDNRSNGLDVKR